MMNRQEIYSVYPYTIALYNVNMNASNLEQ